MPTRKKVANEDQVLSNKKILREAEDMSILNSWFTSTSSNSKKSATNGTIQTSTIISDELPQTADQDTEEDNFSAESDTGGLDSIKHTTLSTESGLNRQNLSTNNHLRRQFLGKAAAHVHSKPYQHQGQTGSTPRPSHQQRQQPHKTRARHNTRDEDDDTEEGRTQITTSKRPRDQTHQAKTMAQQQPSAASPNKSAKKRKATTYLDEMLAKRSKKKPARQVDD